jgi:hypothetical protein
MSAYFNKLLARTNSETLFSANSKAKINSSKSALSLPHSPPKAIRCLSGVHIARKGTGWRKAFV